MNITIIGASAGLGLETVKRALERNHNVTTLSRTKVELEHDSNINSIIGSALNKEDIIKAIQNSDAIIVALGTRKNMKATRLFSDFGKLILEIQSETKSSIPHIFVTGFGVGDSKKYAGLFVKFFIRYFLKDVYADKNKMEEIVLKSQMNWIIVRPGRLLDKPRTEKYRIETKLYRGMNLGGISRADLADFLVKQAENPTEIKKFVYISEN